MFGDISKKIFKFPSILYRLYNNLVVFRVKNFTPSKSGETGLQKLKNGESVFGETPLKIAHGINFAPKIVHG